MVNKELEIIRPPSPEFDEKDHRLAYYKCLLEGLFYDNLLGMWLDIRARNPELSELARHAEYIIKLFDEWDSSKDKEVWEYMIPYEEFVQEAKEYLSDEHHGDCVAAPMTCLRCYYEELYEIPSTVTWKGKHEGAALYRKYRELKILRKE